MDSIQDIAHPGSPPPAQERVVGLTSIVVTTHDDLTSLRACLAALERHTPEDHEVIVVDGASRDGTRAWLERHASSSPRVRRILPTEDPGYAAACNLGIAAARGDVLVLMHDDVVVTAGWLASMLEALASSPKPGFIGPMTNQTRGIQKVPAVGYRAPDDGLDAWAAAFRERYRHRRLRIERPVGFCVLCRRELTDAIGVLDERFPSGDFADEDLGLRARVLGHDNLVAGDVFVHHHGTRELAAHALYPSAARRGDYRLFNEKWNRMAPESLLATRYLTVTSERWARDLFARGTFGPASKTMAAAIERAPEDQRLKHSFVEMLLRLEQFQPCLDLLGNAADTTSRLLAGYAHAGLGDALRARAAADLVLEREPANARAANLRGVIAFQTGDRDDASLWFSRAVAADPSYGEPLVNLGVQAWSEGKHAQALELLERGFVLDPSIPDHASTWYKAVSALELWGRAAPLLADAHAILPASKQLTFLLIDALLHQGENARALALAEQAMADFGADEGMVSAALRLRRELGPHRGSLEPSISVCMIVKNEAHNLPRCLSTLKPIAGELVIVDTGSTDATRDIAEAFGAKVYEHPWTGDFSEARNVSLDKAEGDWILVMDADEVVARADHDVIVAMTRTAEARNVAWAIVTRNYTPIYNLIEWTGNDGSYANEEAGTGWCPSTKLRLFPNDRRIRFQNRVHELVEPAVARLGLKVRLAPIPIHHYGKLETDRGATKTEGYYDLCKKKVAETPDLYRVWHELAVEAEALGKHDESLAAWQRAIAIESNAIAWVNVANIHLDQRRYAEATAAIEKAATHAPTMREVTSTRAKLRLVAGDAAQAVAMFEELTKREPSFMPAHLMLSVACACAGDGGKAASIMRSLRSLGPGYDEFALAMTRSLLESERPAYARAVLAALRDAGAGGDELEALYRRCAA